MSRISGVAKGGQGAGGRGGRGGRGKRGKGGKGDFPHPTPLVGKIVSVFKFTNLVDSFALCR